MTAIEELNSLRAETAHQKTQISEQAGKLITVEGKLVASEAMAALVDTRIAEAIAAATVTLNARLAESAAAANTAKAKIIGLETELSTAQAALAEATANFDKRVAAKALEAVAAQGTVPVKFTAADPTSKPETKPTEMTGLKRVEAIFAEQVRKFNSVKN